uniref:Acyl-CoA-binding domain-containing protein 6 n=1 Tax=Hirondellea gigas TaxID=1518452 RepID=A0A2P2I7B0_9CRUS
MDDQLNIENKCSLEQTFNQASKHFTGLVSSLSSEDLLFCYARYKQATEGDCNIGRPSLFNLTGRRKWDAWNALRGLDKNEAMLEYVRAVKERDPSWCPENSENTIDIETTTSWVRVSKLAPPPPEDDTLTADGEFLDAVRGGSLDALQQLDLAFHNTQRFDNDMTGLHWAADRGQCEVVKLLLVHGADINAQDDVGQTALHYAASCGYANVITLLLHSGADATVTDEDDLTAKQVAADEVVRMLQ